MSHKIEFSRTNRFARTVSRNQYCTNFSTNIIVIRKVRQRLLSDIGRVRFGVGELNVLGLMDPRVIHSITVIGERKALEESQKGIQKNLLINVKL